MKYLSNVVTLTHDPQKCTGCALCSVVCPHGVFVMQSRRARITELDRCMECGACMRNCDSGAIRVDAGVGCAAAIIHSMIYGGEPSCDCSGPAATGGCC